MKTPLEIGQRRRWVISQPADHLANGMVFTVKETDDEDGCATGEYEGRGYCYAPHQWMVDNSEVIE